MSQQGNSGREVTESILYFLEKVVPVECSQLMLTQADSAYNYQGKMGVTVCRMSFSHVPKNFCLSRKSCVCSCSVFGSAIF
jgi:hypothetical protein